MFFKKEMIPGVLMNAIFLILAVFTVKGQNTVHHLPQSYRVNLTSPYHSVQTHLHFLQPGNFEPEKSAMAFLHAGVDTATASDLAIKLKQAWDGRGNLVNTGLIPRNTEYMDSITGRHIYIPISHTPEIYLEKQPDGRWLYSLKSLDEIYQFHSEVFPYGADRIINLLPSTGTHKFMGLFLWQHIGILVIITLAFLFHKLLTLIFNGLLYKGASRMGYDSIVRPYLLPVARPLSLFVVFMLIMILFPLLMLPPKASFYINIIFRFTLPFFATLVFYKLVDVIGLYLQKLADKTEGSLDDQLVPLIRKILRVFVVIVGALFILQNLDVNITALLAGLSIGGLAVALAAQDTLKNMFGSFMIFIDKPFMVGHWITSGDIDGTVEEVGFRSTRIRSFRNSLIYVPNGKLADTTIDNHGLRKYRRFYTHIAVTYDTPPDLIEVFVIGLRKIVEDHPDTRKDYYMVEMNEMGEFSLKIMFYIFFDVPTWPLELRARHQILIQIIRLAEKLGVRFAFPTQTVHLETHPGHGSLTPQYDMTMDEFRVIMDDYFKTRKADG